MSEAFRRTKIIFKEEVIFRKYVEEENVWKDVEFVVIADVPDLRDRQRQARGKKEALSVFAIGENPHLLWAKIHGIDNIPTRWYFENDYYARRVQNGNDVPVVGHGSYFKT